MVGPTKPYTMPPDTLSDSPESDVTSALTFKDTELTLGIPGEPTRSPAGKFCTKRGFIETVDLNLRTSTSKPRGKTHADEVDDKSDDVVSGACKTPASK